jgi:glutathione S-transferase
MRPHSLTTIVTIAALLLYLGFAFRVAIARKKANLHAPRMSGDEIVERHLRVQANTLEWLPLFLVPLWLYAIHGSDVVAALLGCVWIIGRVIYAAAYVADPDKRTLGFWVQALACLALMAMALWKAVYVLLVFGA